MRKMSRLILAASVGVLLSSQIGVTQAQAAEAADQRYILALYSMPTMTYSDVKACSTIMKIGESEFKKTPGVVGRLMAGHGRPYWKFLKGLGSKSKASKKDVLVDGAFIETDVAPSYTVSGSLIERSEQCGFVTGQVLMQSGFVNVSDALDIEDENENVSFESNEALGLYLLGEAAEDLQVQNKDMVAECSAVMRLSLPLGVEPEANYVLWMSALAVSIGEGDLNPASLSKAGVHSKRLYGGKRGLAAAAEGLNEELKTSCDTIAASALEKVVADFQK